MRRVGVAVLCAVFLVGMPATSLVHVHPATEHQHGAQDQHHHESVYHAHIPGSRDSDPGPQVANHGPNEAAAIYLSCRSVTPKAPSTVPGLSAVIVGACDDPARKSSLELSRVTHPRAPPYLIGPSPRAPPA